VSTRRRWNCPECKWRNEPGHSRTCAKCGKVTRPKRRVTRHAHTLRDDSYAAYARVAAEIHGVIDDSCNVCGKPRPETRRWDRDHGHIDGRPRGIVCGGNSGCNVLMAKWVTAATARGIADAKDIAYEPDAPRWHLIAAYLERVEAFYAREAVRVG
jgi:hypothetical protein